MHAAAQAQPFASICFARRAIAERDLVTPSHTLCGDKCYAWQQAACVRHERQRRVGIAAAMVGETCGVATLRCVNVDTRAAATGGQPSPHHLRTQM